jgi:hypothetical protein
MRVGAIVRAGGGPAQNVRLMVAVPLECKEQKVELLEEDVSPVVEKVEYRLLNNGGARQMLVYIPQLLAHQEARAIITCEVTTYRQLPPTDTTDLHAPKRVDHQLKQYLGPSKMIETGHRKFKQVVKELLEKLEKGADGEDDKKDDEKEKEGESENDLQDKVADKGGDADAAESKSEVESDAVESPNSPVAAAANQPVNDWRRVEAFYDYAQEHVKYVASNDKTALAALKDGHGDCQAITALFVALCRTAKIPARSVWVHDHQYGEFYLEDAEGNGHWYPMESAGARAFGEMPTAHVIMQKGDNFNVPERPRERLPYANDYGKSDPVGPKPKVTFVREQL